MDDGRRRWAGHPERVHVRHHVVPHLQGQHEHSFLNFILMIGNLPLLSSRLLEVDVVQLASHLLQLLVGDVETKLLKIIISIIVPFLFIAVIFLAILFERESVMA